MFQVTPTDQLMDAVEVNQLFETGKKIYKDKTQDKVARSVLAFDSLYQCAKKGHPEAMYLTYKIIIRDPSLNPNPNSLIEAYDFLGQAAVDKEWPAALEKIEKINDQELDRKIRGALNFFKGKIAEKKATKLYQIAIANQYHPAEPTPLFQSLLKDSTPKSRKRLFNHYDVSDPEESTRTSRSAVYWEEEEIKPDEMVVEVSTVNEKTETPSTATEKYYLDQGKKHLENYQTTKQSSELDSAIRCFSEGWNNFRSNDCRYRWGVALLESDSMEFRDLGIQIMEQAAESSSCYWISLGRIYEEGIKVPKNEIKARECYFKGLAKKFLMRPATPLFYDVEMEYKNDNGVLLDKKEGSLRKAEVYLENKNYNDAFLLLASLSSRDLKAKCLQAKMLIHGWGCQQNVGLAMSDLMDITEKNLKEPSEILGEAQYLLGLIFLGGKNLNLDPLDENTALDYFEKAAENNGHPLAAYEAGCIHEKKKDHAKALKFFEIGKKLQNPMCIEKYNAYFALDINVSKSG